LWNITILKGSKPLSIISVPKLFPNCISSGQIKTSTNIYWSCDTANIIVCSWNGTWYEIAACNAWANIAYTNQTFPSAIASRNSTINSWAWWLYQWWNNADISYAPTDANRISITTDNSTYSNSFFIWRWDFTLPWDWSSVKKNNLWWDITNTNEARRWPCEIWYHIPTKNEWSNLLLAWWWWSNEINMISDLKIPLTWTRDWYSLGTSWQWLNWLYWSSSIKINPSPIDVDVYMLYFSSWNINVSQDTRQVWYAIRCFKN